ncbi:dermonecrotic toxin domain-containing protein [Pseudomonas sp. SDO55104_S430]
MKRKQASHSAAPQHPASHYQHLKNAIPHWLGQASPARRLALKGVQPRLADHLKNASPDHHQEMKALNVAHWTAQNNVDQHLSALQDVNAFAEPLLKEALRSRFGLDLDVRTTFLHLYVPASIPWFPVKTGARAWTVSLLDAALHNFETQEVEDDAYESHSTFITAPDAKGQFDTLPALKQKLGIPTFIRLCRELDIGAQYARHLDEHLGLSEPVSAAVLRLKIDASQKAAMQAALQLARMNRDISEVYLRLIGGLLDGLQGMRIDGQPLLCHDLTMLSARLTGIVVFAPDLERTRQASRVVAYVPDDPEHPFKEYGSTAEMAAELIRQLRARDYQQFFSRFVDHDQRGVFFANLNHRLSKMEWHEPVRGSALPTWRETPIDNPNLQFAITPINANLWQHLYEARLNKILNDARVIAVSTASADQKARWALWDSFVEIASAILQTAALIIAPFVPVMGELMMAYMAYQLLDETFEGIIDWAEGLTTEAFEHLMGTVESLVQLGIFGVGGAIGAGEFRKVLPKEIVEFIDSFKPVMRPDGATRYWKPDLASYQQNLLPDSPANELGLHPHQGKHLLPIEDTHFAVREDKLTGLYRIDHPARPDAYKPTLRHNGEGAWHTELEQPLEWDAPTVLRRIGPAVDDFSPARREQILKVSGYSEDVLRKMHVNQEPVPPLLADSIRRFKIDQDLHQFIEQLDSDQYLDANPLTQLQLLAEHKRWPADKRLRWIDGETTWQSSADQTLPLIELRPERLIKSDPLNTLLSTLSESEIKTLLDEEASGPLPALDVRARLLRKQLVQIAHQQRSAMFESRYKKLERLENPLPQQIPELPTSITRELLNTATDSERQQIRAGQLPERQQVLMQLASEDVRVTRAFEGLELDSVNNPDTDTLALHSLQGLPGWSGQVRIEVRDLGYEGKLLDSTGPADAPQQKVLVKLEDGNWQPYDDRGQALSSATDFYSSVLSALPDTERQALDIHIGQGQKLKDAIRARPLERSELRVAIALPPMADVAPEGLRLVTSDGYRRQIRSLPYTLEDRARQIYPAHSPEEIQTLIATLQRHPDGVRAELSRLNSEYIRLSNDLHRWANDVPGNDPATGLALTDTQLRDVLRNRALMKEAIQRSWRKEARGLSGYTLQIHGPIMGELPVLDADFSHIAFLSIDGPINNTNVDAFLQRFPGLLHLDLKNIPLQALPQPIARMPGLRQLIVQNAGIRYTPADQQKLSALPALTLLDLQGNPLAHTPNVNRLPALRHLNLANTGISRAPAGLLEHPHLLGARLSGNRISELPAGFFELHADLSGGFDFSNNPLTAVTRERVKLYYARTGRHYGVLAEQADIDRTIALFPDRDAQQATDLIYRLPGTLTQGRLQLTAWENEITQLTRDLAQWSTDIPTRHPTTGQSLGINEIFSEQVARKAFATELEGLWRRRLGEALNPFRAELKFIGDMPEVAADFSHVSSMGLTGNGAVTAIDPFLQRFTGLRTLHLNEFDLKILPQSITRMPQLDTLILHSCGVVFTPEGQTALASLRQLEALELTHNPLATAPDLSAMPSLTYVDLSNTGIDSVPAGLIDHPKLKSAVFSNNLITELPEALYQLPVNRIDGLDFADNPLSLATQERIKTAFRNTGQDFGVWADPDDLNLATDLFPALDFQDASDMIYDLPGTLEDGRVQLRHWKAELTQLTQDLTAWVREIPSQHPVSGERLSATELYDEYVFRSQFKDKLEQFWRSRSEASHMRETGFEVKLNFVGDLPTLTTDFSHVSSLSLTGNGAVRATGPFLELFANVHTLEMNHFALGHIPRSVTRLPLLKALRLNNCRLRLTPGGQTALATLARLETLDLSENPLAIAPDLSGLPLLSDIRLSKTGIDTVPNGITALEQLSVLHLDGNRISELPDGFLTLNMDMVEEIDLGENPWSTSSRNKIKTCYAQSGYDFNVRPEQADMDRVQALFPALDDEGASHVIYKLPGTLEDGRAQLVSWETEIAQLIRDLGQWTDDIASHNPATGQRLSVAELNEQRSARNEFAQQLEQFWRKRSTEAPEARAEFFAAQPTFFGELPAVTSDFSHVVALSLSGTDFQSVPSRFLECFPGLQHLEIRDFNVGRVPQAVSNMPALENLVLTHCGVVLDAEGLAALTSRANLEMLDLFENPLGQVPDLTSLPKLKFIDLSRTGIERIPNGLLNHPALETAILGYNRIKELPEAAFQLPITIEVSKGFDFGDNPYTDATRERIKAYHQKTAYDLGVLAPEADIDQAMELYPNLDVDQASEMVYHLPGTLADGRQELARKKAELDSLISDLTVWTTDIPDHPVTGLPLSGEALLQEQGKRREFKASLERCWRKIPSEHEPVSDLGLMFHLSFMGDLPVLTADFGHVPELYLTSTTDLAPRLGRFLDYFPNLQSLSVRGYQLDDLPEMIFKMKRLTALSLPECRVTLSRTTANALAGMDNLNSLNLRDNPLGRTPDLRNLRELSTLNLSNTGLREIPRGVLDSRALMYADLSDNAITEMPVELMETNPDNTADFDFSGNPFTPQSLQRIAAYFHDTGNTLGIEAVAGMPRPGDIAPDVDMES